MNIWGHGKPFTIQILIRVQYHLIMLESGVDRRSVSYIYHIVGVTEMIRLLSLRNS